MKLIKNPEERATIESYMYSNPVDTLKSLSLDLIAQLQPDMTFEELADQVVKNLIFIGRILKSAESPNIVNSDNEAVNKDGSILSLGWLMRRLRKSVNIELIQAPKSISVVSVLFRINPRDICIDLYARNTYINVLYSEKRGIQVDRRYSGYHTNRRIKCITF